MDCLFCKIAEGRIPAKLVHSDDEIVAFDDINPQAPHHFLVITRKHIATLNEVAEADQALVGRMVLVAAKLAAERGIAKDGYRTVFNCNSHGGQQVYHIHLHVLGGRRMTWPPG